MAKEEDNNPTSGSNENNGAATDSDTGQSAARYPGMKLSEHDAALLAGSAISPDVAAERPYWTVKTKADLKKLGFSEAQQLVPALVCRIAGLDPDVITHQIRPLEPRYVGDKVIKYETPKGSRLLLDVPNRCRTMLLDVSVPLFATEGSRKVDAGASIGLCVIGILGVHAWRRDGRPLTDWDLIPLKGRRVHLAMDSDVMTKSHAYGALKGLAEFLTSKGAIVSFIYFPPLLDGKKCGLDDFIAAGNGPSEILALEESRLRAPSFQSRERPSPYLETPSGFVRVRSKATVDGDIATTENKLSNFTARITSEVTEDDGVERQLQFNLDVKLSDGDVIQTTVPAVQFSSMKWVIEKCGMRASIEPGFGNVDFVRAAIQDVSDSVERITRYRQTGWRKIGGLWTYLHAGGSIDAHGNHADVNVSKTGVLAKYELGEVLAGDELVRAIRRILVLLTVAVPYVAFSGLAAAFRAAIRPADFAMWFVGITGSFKSEIGSLLQRFFGVTMDARHLPGSWESTANMLEDSAFMLACALYTVDDYKEAESSQNDLAKKRQFADRLIRSQGNNTGRGRLNSAAEQRPVRPPRGLILSTGEVVPPGESLQARLIVVELGREHVNVNVLTEVQRDAESGLYSDVMASFLAFLAPYYHEIEKRWVEAIRTMRSHFMVYDSHGRTPDNIANLFVAAAIMLRFFRIAGAIGAGEERSLLARFHGALRQLSARQGGYLKMQDPARRFIGLVRSAIASGKAHVSNVHGTKLDYALGPRERTFGGSDDRSTRWEPQGTWIGWLEDDQVLLVPALALEAVQRLAQGNNLPLAITADALPKAMGRSGLIVKDVKRDVWTWRKRHAGVQHDAVLMDLKTLTDAEDLDGGSTTDVGFGRSGTTNDGPTREVPAAVAAAEKFCDEIFAERVRAAGRYGEVTQDAFGFPLLTRNRFVRDPTELAATAQVMGDATRISLVLSRTGDSPWEDSPTSLTLTLPDHGIAHQVDLRTMKSLSKLASVLDRTPVLVHDAVSTLAFLQRHYGFMPRKIWDLRTADILIAGGSESEPRDSNDLSDVVDRWSGLDVPTSMRGGAFKPGEPNTGLVVQAGLQCRCWERMTDELQRLGLSKVAELECDVAPIVAAMELTGVKLDVAGYREHVNRQAEKVRKLKTSVETNLGIKNVDNDDALLEGLNDHGIKLEGTSKEDLLAYAEWPVVKRLLRYRALKAEQSTWGMKPFLAATRDPEHRLRGHIDQVGTVTGRLASSRFNLMGLPANLRQFVVAPDGHLLLHADFSQMDPRVAAVVMEDEGMLKILADGGDLYVETAAFLFDRAASTVSKDERKIAKAITFSLLYGGGPESVQNKLLVDHQIERSTQELAGLRGRFLERHKGVASYQSKMRDDPRVVTTLMGRRRVFDRPHGERPARMNFPIQGTAADGFKVALIALAKELPALGARLVLTTHDDVLLEIPEQSRAAAERVVPKALSEGMEAAVPGMRFPVKVSISKSWTA